MHLQGAVLTSAILGGISALAIHGNHSLSAAGLSSAGPSTPSLGIRHVVVGDGAGDGKGSVGIGRRTPMNPAPAAAGPLAPGFDDPIDHAAYDEHRLNGMWLLDQMLDEHSAIPGKPEVSRQDLTSIGWNVRSRQVSDIAPFKILRTLRGVQGLLQVKPPARGHFNRQLTSMKPTDWTDTNVAYHQNVANYRGLYEKEGSAVVLLESHAPWPQDEVVQTTNTGVAAPRIRDFSEIAEYAMRSSQLKAANLAPRWFLISLRQVDEATRRQVVASLTGYGYNDLPAWPGVTLPIGSSSYNTILGTPDVKPVVYYLNQHKTRYGQVVLTSITVFDSGHTQNGNKKVPSFLINTQNISPQLKQALNENKHFEQKYLDPNLRQLPQWPWPLKPTPLANQAIAPAPLAPAPPAGGPSGGRPPAKRPPPSDGGPAPKRPGRPSKSGGIQGSSKNPHAGQQHRGQR